MPDKKLMCNFEIPDKISIIDKLHPWVFNYKGSTTSRLDLIAQDLADIIPEAVQCREDGYLEIDYNALISVLIIEIQLLKQKLEGKL